MKKSTRFGYAVRRLPYLAVILACVAADYISKLLVLRDLKSVGDVPLIDGVFHLTYVENRGAAFGILSQQRWIFLIASAVAIVAIIAVLAFYRDLKPLGGIALALVCGGGIGNMIDRVSLGFVVDFFNFELIHFAVFNVADSFVTVGVGLLIFYLIFFEFRSDSTKEKNHVG